jgi:hypothetical protein
MKPITVIKKNVQGVETYRYTGRELQRSQNYVLLEALFERPDIPFHEIFLNTGDRFLETYYDDRWYNIYEIHDRQDGNIKAWYCNISYPATIDDDRVSFVDLALDLLVYPDGRQIVLDEDEFIALKISPEDRSNATSALST